MNRPLEHLRLLALRDGPASCGPKVALCSGFLVGCLLLLAQLSLPLRVVAEGGHEVAPAAASSAASSQNIDAVLLLDASASMRVTDPARLRDEGAKLFTKFLNDGDTLAIIEFSDQTKVIRALSEYSPAGETQAAAEIDMVGDNGIYTDIYAAIEAGVNLLNAQGRADAEKLIVLLSDGMMEPDSRVATAERRNEALFNELLPEARAVGIKVDTIGFSDKADQELLKQIAVATDGVNFFAASPDDLHKYFAELFLAAKKPQVLPLTSKGFKVDAAIEEATFYISRDGDGSGEITLIAPSGARITAKSKNENVRWFEGSKFDVVTIAHPEPGDWIIDGLASKESFATILTNLKLVIDWPASVFEGAPTRLEARLYEGNKPVELTGMLGEVAYGVRILPTDRVSEPVLIEKLSDGGEHGDTVKGDGNYSLEIELDRVGEYKIEVIAKAPTFERKQQLPFRVKERLVNVEIEKSHEEGKGDLIKIILSPEAERIKGFDLKLIATDSERKRYTVPVKASQGHGGEFELSTDILPKPGKYTLQAQLSGDSKRGKIREDSRLVEYEKAAVEGESHVVVVAEGEQKPVESGFPWLALIVAVVAQLSAIAFNVFVLKKALGGSAKAAPELPSIAEAEAAITRFEATVQKSQLAPDDPIITDQNMEFSLRDQDRHWLDGRSSSSMRASAAVSVDQVQAAPGSAAVAQPVANQADEAPAGEQGEKQE